MQGRGGGEELCHSSHVCQMAKRGKGRGRDEGERESKVMVVRGQQHSHVSFVSVYMC